MHRSSTYRLRRPSAFTLIELLVVIAIIAILAAILFPVFARAREKARQTSCLSNLKQIGTGILMYAQDHDEGLPPVEYGDCGTPGAYAWADLIFPYVKNAQVFDCPSASDRMVQNTALNPPRFYRDGGGMSVTADCATGVALNGRNYNYGVNAFDAPTNAPASGDPAFRGPFRPVRNPLTNEVVTMTTMSEMPAPAGVVGVADGVSPTPWGISGGGDAAYVVVNVTNQVDGRRHQGVTQTADRNERWANFMFMDGHAKYSNVGRSVLRPGNAWTMSDKD